MTLYSRLHIVFRTLIVGWGASLLVRFVMPRTLGPDVFGNFIAADAIAQSVMIAVSWGFAEWIARSFPQDKTAFDEHSGAIVQAMFTLFLPFFILLLALVHLLNYDRSTIVYVALSACSVFAVEINQVGDRLAQVQGHYERIGFLTRVMRWVWAISSVLVFTLSYLEKITPAHALQLFFIITIACELFRFRRSLSISQITFRSRRLSIAATKSLLGISFSFFLNRVFVLVYNRIPAIMLSNIAGGASMLAATRMHDLGIYGVSLTLNNIVLMFIPAVQSVVMPHLSRLSTTEPTQYDREFKSCMVIVMLASGFVAMWIMALAPRLVPILFGTHFTEAWKVVLVSAPTLFMTYCLVLLSYHLMIEKKERVLTVFSFFGIAVTFVSSYFLIINDIFPTPALAAAFATTVNEFFMLMMMTYLARKKIDKHMYAVFFYVMASLVLVALWYAKNTDQAMNAIPQMMGAVAAYLLVAALFWGRTVYQTIKRWQVA